MKKMLFLLAATSLLTACVKDSENHYVNIVSPAGGTMGAVYADQTLDSIVFLTTDSYRCTYSASWMSIKSNASKNLKNYFQTIYPISLPVSFEINTSGAARTATISIQSYGNNWDQQITTGFVQFGWPNIERPSAYITYQGSLPDKAEFDLVVPASEITDSLIFNVRDSWTLEGNGAFATPASQSGKSGRNKVMLSLQPNTAKEKRTDKFVLTTSGVSTTITVTQQAAKE